MSVSRNDLVPGFQLGWYSDQDSLIAEFEVVEVLDGKVVRMKVLRSRRPEMEGRIEHYGLRDVVDWASRIRPGVGVFA